MDSWIVPAWRPKNKEVLRIGFVDNPRMSLKNKEVVGIGLVDRPRVESSKQGGVQDLTSGSSPRSVPDRPRVEL